MGRSSELYLPTPPQAAFNGEIKSAQNTQDLGILFNSGLQMLEGQILTIQAMQEMTGTITESRRFNDLAYSKDPHDRDLYFSTAKTRGSQKLILINGFTPYNPATENPFGAVFYDYWQNALPTLKSNIYLEAKKGWYERHGHKASFAFDNPNHLWFQNYKDAYNTTIDAISESELNGRDIWIAGLSGGGMIGEMLLKELAKKGIAINLITNGSPEVSEKNLKLFDNSTRMPGLMGSVHKAAQYTSTMDLDYERMQEEIHKAAESKFHPDSVVIRFYSNNDNVCPPPDDPNAIEVGGNHTSIPYRKIVLEMEAELLADQKMAIAA